MERCADGEGNELEIDADRELSRPLAGAVHGGSRPGEHHLVGRVLVGHVDPVRVERAGEVERRHARAAHRHHRALARRHGRLHERAAPADELHRDIEGNGAGRAERRELAEAVAPEHARREPELGLERAKHGDLRRQDRGLRELREVEPRVVAEAEGGHVEPERLAGLGEDRARRREAVAEVPRHPRSLRALTRKDDRNPGHRPMIVVAEAPESKRSTGSAGAA